MPHRWLAALPYWNWGHFIHLLLQRAHHRNSRPLACVWNTDFLCHTDSLPHCSVGVYSVAEIIYAHPIPELYLLLALIRKWLYGLSWHRQYHCALSGPSQNNRWRSQVCSTSFLSFSNPSHFLHHTSISHPFREPTTAPNTIIIYAAASYLQVWWQYDA